MTIHTLIQDAIPNPFPNPTENHNQIKRNSNQYSSLSLNLNEKENENVNQNINPNLRSNLNDNEKYNNEYNNENNIVLLITYRQEVLRNWFFKKNNETYVKNIEEYTNAFNALRKVGITEKETSFFVIYHFEKN